MTAGESIQPKPRDTKFPEQNADGVDLSIIRANLRLTPLQRYEKNYNGMSAMLQMRRMLKPLRPGASSEDGAA